MRKLLLMLVAGLLIAAPSQVDAASYYQKQLKKRVKKEYKEKVKKYNKEGWQVFGSSHTIEVVLLNHYEKLTDEDCEELVGYATSSQKNIGSAKLIQDALEKYAALQGSNIKGRTVTEHGSDLTESDLIELDNFLQGFDSKIQTDIQGEVKPSFMLYRESKTASGKPCYEFEGYYIVNVADAHRIRMKALEAQFQEQAAMHKLSEKTSQWVKEAFEEEEAQFLDK